MITDIRIINSLGQVINSVSLDSSDKLNIDFSNYNKGVYFVNLRFKDGNHIIKKIIK
ncbi:MAG TPA: T9SS type A sorting domain-containing protein [Flavobacteriaceae bacterium]|nr:T9SS type A sorting domain-containing protein [Flavobacteriaceae bacterium]